MNWGNILVQPEFCPLSGSYINTTRVPPFGWCKRLCTLQKDMFFWHFELTRATTQTRWWPTAWTLSCHWGDISWVNYSAWLTWFWQPLFFFFWSHASSSIQNIHHPIYDTQISIFVDRHACTGQLSFMHHMTSQRASAAWMFNRISLIWTKSYSLWVEATDPERSACK